MVEWLAVWGVAKAGLFVFRPILEDLAKDVVRDAARSSVGTYLRNAFSAVYHDPMAKSIAQTATSALFVMAVPGKSDRRRPVGRTSLLPLTWEMLQSSLKKTADQIASSGN